GMTYAAILRSPHAHARIKSINVEKAKAHPGVVGVFTGADLTGRVVPTAWNIPASDLKTPPHPALAVDTVRHVGDGVAVVVAEDRYTAEDALELIEVEYEPLPATVNAEAATKEGAPQVHDDVPNNQAFHWKLAAGEIDKAFQEADVVVKQRLINNRVIPTAIEPRAAIAQYDANMGELTVWSTSQNPHIARFLFSALLALPEHRIRVIAPDVGGGFGSKISFYADELIVAHLAMALGRPVKWTETRRENYLATTHGRDHITEVELAAKRDGTLLGLRGTTYANMGAYLSTAAPGVPTILHGLVLPGAYRLPAVDYDVYGVFTNTTPVDAYRGAGRPEATYIIERMVDVLARELGLDPVEVRRKNFIPADQFPYTTVTAIIYDSGNYEGALNKALEIFDYQGFRQEQARLRQEGRYLGVGFSTYLEICGLAPSRVAGAVGFGGGLWEGADVRVSPTGKILVAVGTSPHGQGEEIAFAQIVAEELGISVDDVEVLHGDTARTPMGWGTYGSRTAAVSGPAILLAARKVKEKARKIAAHLLEAAEADMEFEAGKFYVRGSPDRAKTFQEVA
ncbi:MAG: xanthine dehydrogenase family protein molybdopterin-binding subunit, partial [Dehalococcoidia bacterium]